MGLSSTEFLGIFMAAVYMYYYENVDPDKKPIDTLPNELLQNYDFIIVGAGTAGCVVANRLSENPTWTILLVEAGGDENAISDTPNFQSMLWRTEMDWNYTTVEQKTTCRKSSGICTVTAGRVMGGSSTRNGMWYVRGNKADYNKWVSMGNDGWSYEEVLPYFKKSENAIPPELANSKWHGTKGPLKVQFQSFVTPLKDRFIKAGTEFGLKEVDYNGEEQIGVAQIQVTMGGTSRKSSSKVFLNPIRNRKNLHISKHSLVTKLNIGTFNNRINGISFIRDGKTYTVEANKEVILSAGALNSPKLLMLSGVGPRDHLESVGIPVLADLPVGKNLQDHFTVFFYFSLNKLDKCSCRLFYSNETIIKYAKHGRGLLTFNQMETFLHMNVFSKRNKLPNIQIGFGCKPLKFEYSKKNVIQIMVTNISPQSKGNVKLMSKDPKFQPLIDPNYLNKQIDFNVTKYGLKTVFKFLETPAMKSLKPKIYLNQQPECKKYKKNTDKLIDCFIKELGSAGIHFVGTAKMGPKNDKTAVVNPELLVHGFENLRVIDASVMPTVTRGNTATPTIMIGEKGSDLIKQRYSN